MDGPTEFAATWDWEHRGVVFVHQDPGRDPASRAQLSRLPATRKPMLPTELSGVLKVRAATRWRLQQL